MTALVLATLTGVVLGGELGTPAPDAFRLAIRAATPSLTTSLSSTSVALGPVAPTVTDTAVLAGGMAPTGSITFQVFTASDCSGSALFASTVPVADNGSYPSGPFAPPGAGTYYWLASYSGDGNNTAAQTTCPDPSETLTVLPASPTMTTSASPASFTLTSVSQSVADSATLSGGFVPTGSITFSLYYNDNTCLAGNLVFTSSPVTVSGDGTYPSTPGFTPQNAGTYYWIADYSGDVNNQAVTTSCGDPGESLAIQPASPTMTTSASPPTYTLGNGGTVGDTATLSGGYNPTGSITFTLYYNDNTCGPGSLVFTSSAVTVTGDGTYPSTPGFTPQNAGTYYWTASYTGDANNNPVTTPCGASGETLSVSPSSSLTITTTATPAALALSDVPASAIDEATLSGGINPTGTITFTLYRNDNTCSPGSLVFTSNPITVNGDGTYSSNAFTPTLVGTYYWIAAYSGDKNDKAASTHCGDAGEILTVNPASPTVSTAVSPATVTLGPGGPYTAADTATLAGGFNPTGTITFTAYDTAGCTGSPIFSDAVTVSAGNAMYTSGAFTVPAAGTYSWIAAYSGDAENNAFTTHCGDAGETLTALPATPSVATQVTPTDIIFSPTTPSTATDAATLSGGFQPTGTLTFNVYGAAGCAGYPAFTSAKAVNGNGPYTSAAFTIPGPGTYYWVAGYSGDGNNFPFASACGDTMEIVTVTSGNAPLASFTFSPSLPTPNTTVTFDGSNSRPTNSGATITSYAWTFGDGATGTGVTVTHVYPRSGAFTATLTVTDSYGYTNQAAGTVVVDAPPVAAFSTAHQYAKIGRLLAFNGSASFDPDGTIVRWTWDFGDGGSAVGAIVSHAYASLGTFEVNLTVVDNKGLIASTVKPIQVVVPLNPTAAFTFSPSTILVNETVTFNGTGSTDPDGAIVSYTWLFGDGTSAAGAIVSHSFGTVGPTWARLTVVDEDGNSSFSQRNMTVLPGPTASFSFSPANPLVNQSVTFTATGTSDVPGGLTFSWTFGDGSSASGATVQHAYTSPGTYTVTLTATNAQGISRIVMQPVTVGSPRGVVANAVLLLWWAAILSVVTTIGVAAYISRGMHRRPKSPPDSET